MFAIFESLGRQYKVSPGDIIQVDRVAENKQDVPEGSQIIFTQVLMLGEEGSDSSQVGAPFVEGASVVGELVSQDLGEKLVVFKKKRRKGYHLKKGFRRKITTVKITDITAKKAA